MLLIIALLLYLLVVVCSFLIVYRYYGIKKWNALIFSLLVGWLVLNIIIPPPKSLQEFDNSIIPGLYLIIELLTIPILMIYVVIQVFRDK